MTGIDFEYIRWARQADETDHYLELMALFARQYHGAQTQAEHYRKEGDAVMEAMMLFWVERALEQHDQCKRLREKQTGRTSELHQLLPPPPPIPPARQTKRMARRCAADAPGLRLKRLAQHASPAHPGS